MQVPEYSPETELLQKRLSQDSVFLKPRRRDSAAPGNGVWAGGVLIPVLPDGAATTFEATGVSLGAMEIGMGSSEYQGYPYDNMDTLGIDLYWVAVG
jgi:hypothetical protein